MNSFRDTACFVNSTLETLQRNMWISVGDKRPSMKT